jgi:hypothetical protein
MEKEGVLPCGEQVGSGLKAKNSGADCYGCPLFLIGQKGDYCLRGLLGELKGELLKELSKYSVKSPEQPSKKTSDVIQNRTEPTNNTTQNPGRKDEAEVDEILNKMCKTPKQKGYLKRLLMKGTDDPLGFIHQVMSEKKLERYDWILREELFKRLGAR